MRTLSGTLETAMEAAVLEPRIRITFSLAAEADVVVEEDRILQIPLEEETSDSQTAEVICDNSDGYFTTLNLEGWNVVFEGGLVTEAGDEYSAIPPMKVLSQNMSSLPGVLQCRFSLIGIPNRLAEDKASKDYFQHWSSTKTVKAMLTEMADGEPVTEELIEEQTTSDGFINLDDTLDGAGQRLTISRTVTKLAFKLKKTGLPTGTNVTFIIRQAEAPEAILASGTFPIASITGVAAWCEVTFGAPVAVDEVVWIYCEYADGDAVKYVQVAYSSVAVKPDEHLIKINGGVVSFTDLDCTYRYKYTGAGIDCWARGTGPETYCESYDVVYDPYGTHTGGTHATIMTDSAAAFKTDALIGQVIYNVTDGSSGTITDNDATTVTVAALAGGGDDQWELNDAYTIEDALLDVYMPKDAYRIHEGQSRWDKIKQLLGYTGEEMIVKADGKIHVFVPVTSGTVYDSEYSLAAGHTFFSKAIRNALVIPNRISVKSLRTDATEYSGAATSATSFALLPVSDYIRTSLVSDAQGVLIAAAMISRLEVAAQRGGASVPMNLGAEVFDYVIVTDSRQSDSRTGNIGYIRRSYRPGTTWRMDFGFGGVALKGVPGTRPSLLQREPIPEPTIAEKTLKWGMIKPSLEIIDDQLDWLYGRGEYANELTGMKWVEAAIAELWGEKGLGSLVATINQILSGLGWLEGETPADEQIPTALLPYYTKTQTNALLALRLLLTGGTMSGAIAMGTNKITGLVDPTANQEAATKKYVDDNAGGTVVWKDTPTRVLTDSNRTTSATWTSIDLTASTSANATAALLKFEIQMDSVSAPGRADLGVRKNGTSPSYHPQLRISDKNGDVAGSIVYGFAICGLDSGQVLQYEIAMSGTIQVDTFIEVLGYIE